MQLNISLKKILIYQRKIEDSRLISFSLEKKTKTDNSRNHRNCNSLLKQIRLVRTKFKTLVFLRFRKTRGVINQNVDVGFYDIRTHVCPHFHRFEISSATG